MSAMVELLIRQPGFPDRVVPVHDGRTHLGRADDNEIVLSDVGVSRRHAAIVVQHGEVFIEDLGSGNGTYYYGHRIGSQPIRDQDEVVIDPFILQFRVWNGPETAPLAGPDTVVAEEGVRLEVVVGNGISGNVFPIRSTGLTMGRAEDRDVVVPDPASSRHHCQISLESGEYVLHDNGSANGVFVNAVRVRECTLSDGDLVRIGNTELRFVNPAAPAPEQAPWVEPPPEPEPWQEHDSPAYPGPQDEDEDDDYDDDPITSDPPARRRERAPEAASSTGGMLAAVAGVGVMIVVVGGVAAMALLALVLYLTSSSPTVAAIPPRPPGWTLTLPPDLQGSDTRQLYQAGVEAAERGDYPLALQNLYRVLLADPSHQDAEKFAVFSAEILVAEQLERELTRREQARMKHETRRDRLLRIARDSANNRAKRDARRELERDFRDDPIVQEDMSWSLTQAQLDERDVVDRMTKHIQTEQTAEVIRLGRRVLDTSSSPDLRDRAHTLLLQAEATQSRTGAARWRQAVFAEAMGNRAEANALYKSVIRDHPTNLSAQLGAARTEP